MKYRLSIITNLFFAILAIIYCCIAPDTMDVSFCQMVSYTFIIHTMLYFAFMDRKNWLGFEFFFAISFFITNFIYPVVIYPVLPNAGFFAYGFNSDVISRATAIAYLGYASFLMGTTKIVNRYRAEPTPSDIEVSSRQLFLIFLFASVSFIGFMAFGGLKALTSVYSEQADLNETGIYSYFSNLFTITVSMLAIFLFKAKTHNKWLYLCAVLFCMLMMLSTGSRTLAIGVVLILLVSFNNNVRKFRFLEILAIIAVGSIILYFIVLARSATAGTSSDDVVLKMQTEKEQLGIVSAFMDLIINNRNLYVLVDYADHHSLTYVSGMLVDIFSPIPGMSNILIKLTGKPIEMIHGGMLPTYLEFGRGSNWGLGTNMIGEAFRSFGYVGVVVSMFLLGQIIKATYYRSRTNKYMFMLYLMLTAHSVFYPRGPILYDPRTVVWSLCIAYIVFGPIIKRLLSPVDNNTDNIQNNP